jgi:GntR family transcriptional regulator
MALIRLNMNSGVPIYRQIQDQIRLAIASGGLQPGEQLPTVRALAVDLAVNPNTIIKAYSELEREGVLTTEQGSGTFVGAATQEPMSKGERRDKLESLCTEFLAHAARYGFSPREIVEALKSIDRTAR